MKQQHNVQTASCMTKQHPFRQWKMWSIPGTQLTVHGYSRSNDKVFFHIPELKCCIDAGLCEGRQPEHVFLTHTHNDHSADIEFLASRDGVNLVVPTQAVNYLETYIRAKRELNHLAEFQAELSNTYHLHGMSANDTYQLGKKGQYTVRIVECEHKIPCIGFAFSQKKTRMKQEFQDLQTELKKQGKAKEFGAIMAEKRKQGIAVSEDFEQPLFVFLGDTHVRVFEKNPWLFQYPVIFTECTYLDEKQAERAEQSGHTLWQQLKPVIEQHPTTTFVLTHFSLRHSDKAVLEFFEAEKQQSPGINWENVVLWATEESFLQGQHQSQK